MKRKCGFEIELVAPRGLSRRTLADAIARDIAGSVSMCFYPQAEPNPQSDATAFETLTLAFQVLTAKGDVLCTIADDLTLREDLDTAAPPMPGWYRILCDDARIERLIARHSSAAASVATVLDPVATLFAGKVIKLQEGYYRVNDSEGSLIGMAAIQPGERERAAEIITSPITSNHHAALETLLAPARNLDFLLPVEGAVHVHFDAADLMSAARMQRLVRLFDERRGQLRARCQPNPRCRRLGPWPTGLLECVNATDFATLRWPEAVSRLKAAGSKKYCDFNITNILKGHPGKLTFEVRILPPSLDTTEILDLARVFSDLLDEVVAAPAG